MKRKRAFCSKMMRKMLELSIGSGYPKWGPVGGFLIEILSQ